MAGLTPERAEVGDVVATNVRDPHPQTLRLTLDTQAAADHFNKLPPAERRLWRLEKRIGPIGCHECAWGKVAGCWRCGSR